MERLQKLHCYSFYISLQRKSQSHCSNPQGLHTPVADKLLLRKVTESKTFYIFTFSFEIQKDLSFEILP